MCSVGCVLRAHAAAAQPDVATSRHHPCSHPTPLPYRVVPGGVQKSVGASFASMFEREVVRKMASKRSANPALRKPVTFNRWDTTGEVYGGDDL